MTWHHVAIILAALVAVTYCGTKPACQAVFPQLVQLATVAISGALGHAGAKAFRPKRPNKRRDDVSR